MENIYKPHHFNATNHVDLEDYFKKYSESLFDQQKSRDKIEEETIFSFFDSNLDIKEREEIKNICSVDNLNIIDEIEQVSIDGIKGAKALATLFQPGAINELSLTLETVKQLNQRMEDSEKTARFNSHLREKSFHIKAKKPEGTGIPNLTPGEDFIVYIRLFRPFKFSYSEPDSYKSLTFDQEISILGSNTLADLRDKISCTVDLMALTEVSKNPKENKLKLAKEIYPSGFIFIDDVFYNDFRDEKAIDYSEVIRNWAKSKKIANFSSAEMQNARINSLKPRFGYPYVYQHQGRCEHVFVFSYARLLSNSDPLHFDVFPFFSEVANCKGSLCFICGVSLPTWLVVNCNRLPQNKSPLCHQCFMSYCYVNGEKVGDFQAFPYANRTALF